MKNDQFAYILNDLKVSIKIDFNKLDLETLKDILINLGESTKLTIRVPYSIEYSLLKELIKLQELTKEYRDRITFDFVD